MRYKYTVVCQNPYPYRDIKDDMSWDPKAPYTMEQTPFHFIPFSSSNHPSSPFSLPAPLSPNNTPSSRLIPSPSSLPAHPSLSQSHTLHPLHSFTFFFPSRSPLSRQHTLHPLHSFTFFIPSPSLVSRQHTLHDFIRGWAGDCTPRHRPARANAPAPARLYTILQGQGVGWQMRRVASARPRSRPARLIDLMQGQGVGWRLPTAASPIGRIGPHVQSPRLRGMKRVKGMMPGPKAPRGKEGEWQDDMRGV
jgi:hypothetical protein